MPIRTTTIGAFPKPDGAPVPLWSEIGGKRREAPTAAYDAILAGLKPADTAILDEMTRQSVRDQVGAGIDIPTDGEIRREHYVYYHCRHIAGIDFKTLSQKVMRDGSWVARVPTVRGPIHAGVPFLQQDWRVAQSATERPVKMTVPGPLTISDCVVDEHYGDRGAFSRAMADVLAVEIRLLAEAGCQWIQIDEPLFARQVGAALDFGVECLERCFAGAPASLNRVVHICCGYPARLDDPEPAKADAGAYSLLAAALDGAAIDAVSIEDAHHPCDLTLLEQFAQTTVILGLVDIASSTVEDVDALRSRLRAALDHIDPGRLIAAPDCGMVLLPRSLALAKLRAISAAAATV